MKITLFIFISCLLFKFILESFSYFLFSTFLFFCFKFIYFLFIFLQGTQKVNKLKDRIIKK